MSKFNGSKQTSMHERTISRWDYPGINRPLCDGQAHEKEENGLRVSGDEKCFLTEVLEFTSQPFAAGYPDGRLIACNHAFCQITGYTHEEFQHMDWRTDLATKQEYEQAVAKFEEVDRGGGPMRLEITIKRKDGTTLPVEVFLHRGVDAEGRHLFYAFITDITERKKAESALKKYQVLSSNTRDIILFIRLDDNMECKIIDANEAAIDTYGYTREELLARSIFDIKCSNTVPLTPEQIEKAQNGGLLFETVHRRKDCTAFPVEVNTVGATIDGEPVLISIIRDITERKRAEETLMRSEANLAEAQRIAHLGSFFLDVDKGQLSWSEEAYRIFGLDPVKEPINLEKFFGMVHPDDRAEMEKVATALAQNHPPIHRRFVTEYRILSPDGAPKLIHSVDEVAFNELGKPVYLFGTVQDITERNRTEQELLEAKEQAELYVDLMSHDINNLNQIGLGFLEMALNRPGLDGEVKSLLLKPVEALKNSSKLIDNMKKLQKVREHTLRLQIIDMSEILQKIRSEHLQTPGKDVNIRLKLAGNYYVKANELLYDVFANIVGNAIKHCQEHVNISISAYKVYEGDTSYYKISVEDDGPGIADNIKSNIFKRSVRGRTKAHGNGLGLFLVKSLVDDYRGRVWVEDRLPGDHTTGSRFVVMLPVA